MRLLTFAAGAAVGYVLGTRAGRERYEQFAAHAHQLVANPTLAQLQYAVADLTSGGNRRPGGQSAATPSEAALGRTGTVSPTAT